MIIGVPQDFTDFNIILKSWLYLTVKEKYEKESKLSGNWFSWFCKPLHGNNIALNPEKYCSMVIGDNDTSQEMILKMSLASVKEILRFSYR